MFSAPDERSDTLEKSALLGGANAKSFAQRPKKAKGACRVIMGGAVLLCGLAGFFAYENLEVTDTDVHVGHSFTDEFSSIDTSMWSCPSEAVSHDCQWTNGDEYCESCDMMDYGKMFENSTSSGLELKLIGDGDCSCAESSAVAGHLTSNDYFLHGTVEFSARFMHQHVRDPPVCAPPLPTLPTCAARMPRTEMEAQACRERFAPVPVPVPRICQGYFRISCLPRTSSACVCVYLRGAPVGRSSGTVPLPDACRPLLSLARG